MERTDSGVHLDGIGLMIEDRHQYEAASALCLLSIARSAERIAEALEKLGRAEFSVARDEFAWIGEVRAK